MPVCVKMSCMHGSSGNYIKKPCMYSVNNLFIFTGVTIITTAEPRVTSLKVIRNIIL